MFLLIRQNYEIKSNKTAQKVRIFCKVGITKEKNLTELQRRKYNQGKVLSSQHETTPYIYI